MVTDIMKDIQELATNAISSLEPVATVLKDTATHLYSVQVKQVIVMGIAQLTWDIVLVCWVFWLYSKTKKFYAKLFTSDTGDSKDSPLAELELQDSVLHSLSLGTLLTGFLLFVVWVQTISYVSSAAAAFPDTLSYLIVPEYKAIQLARDLATSLIK